MADAHPIELTASRFFRKLFFITMFYATITPAIGIPGTGALTHTSLSFILAYVPWLALVTMPLVLIADYLGVRAMFKPIREGLQSLERGQPDPARLARALERTLNWPALTVLRILTLHMGAAMLGSFVFNYVIVPSLALYDDHMFRLITSSWFIIPVLSFTHAIIEYFVVNRAIRPYAAYLYSELEKRSTGEYLKLYPINLRLRLLAITLWITLVPMLLIAVTLVIRMSDALAASGIADVSGEVRPLIIWSATLITFVLLLVSLIIFAVTGDVQRMISQLVEAMTAVQQGRLEAHLVPTMTDEFSALYRGFNAMTSGLQERERLHDAFGRYVAPELAEQVRQTGVTFEGKALEASVLFCDIRDYTATTLDMPPGAVVEWLNRYFAVVEPVVKAHGGWINKFLGDGFMALFGVPVPDDKHAVRAVEAALAIRQETGEFNADHPHQPPIRIGMGIACGEMVAGSIGSPDRLEFTVIGDAVNVASRIEALNKEFGSTLLISEAVYEQSEVDGSARLMPPTHVKGIAEAIHVYALE